MISAAVSNLRSKLPVRKPAASEHGIDAPPSQLVRQAFGTDVVGSNLSPRAQLGYRVLVDHVNRGRDARRPYDGEVFLTDETLAVEVGGVSKRQVQRIRAELLAGGWVCLPKGDAGGRGNSTIWYHLHPDGRPCPLGAESLLKQRSAAANANLQRAARRQSRNSVKDDKKVTLSPLVVQKDDMGVVLTPATDAQKDDAGVALSRQRMTESVTKDDKKGVKDDKTDIAYKEELFQELIPELKPTTALVTFEDFPPEFARLMDAELSLDDGALRRLWQGARAIVHNATAVEIRDAFRQRAPSVYRNRKLDNPTGLMLSTIRDWFSQRRVLEQRSALQIAAEELACLERQLAEHLAALESARCSST